MATCAVLGQALGTAIAQSFAQGKDIRAIDILRLQQTLMADDCYLPWQVREVSTLSKRAHCNAEVIRNGHDRGEENLWIGNKGDFLEYSFDAPEEVQEVRLVFDSDLNRKGYNMPCRYPLETPYLKVPATLVKSFELHLIHPNGNVAVTRYENHQRFVRISINQPLKAVRLVPLDTWGAEDLRVFSFEVL
jgi:hypothetical protein